MDNQQDKPRKKPDQPKERDKAEQIRELIADGYSLDQIVTKFGFNYKTAWQEVRKCVKPEGKPAKGNRQGEPSPDLLPIKAKSGEVVLPEWIANEIDIFDGNERDKKLFQAGMAIPLMGVRLIQEMVKPVADMILAMRREELQAVLEAHGMGKEIAERAAQSVGAQVIEALSQQRPAQPQNPVATMMVNAIQPYFQQAIGKLMGVMMRSTGQPGQPQPGPQPTLGDQPLGQAPASGIQQATEEELKEAFG